MMLYHGTSKDNYNSIKKNGFDISKSGSNSSSTYGKAIYFTNCYKTAKEYANCTGIVIQVYIVDIQSLKLEKDYCPTNKNHIKEINGIILYLKINSNKNCFLSLNKNEYAFFNKFNYKIIN